MRTRIGIVGVSGYGGGEVLRIAAGHPDFEVVYVAGESSAGATLGEKFPGIDSAVAGLSIRRWDPAELKDVELVFASLPSGQSSASLAAVPGNVKIVDIGGDHRYAPGWAYGLADVWPDRIAGQSRVANPGCYPSAALTALAPLAAAGIVRAGPPVIVDAKSGVSGAGRGGGATFGFADVNEDASAYGLSKPHPHTAEMAATLAELMPGGGGARVAFVPHLIPMTRGILATCYVASDATAGDCLAAARAFYAGRPFVRVVDVPPHTKWATGSNLAFVSYAAVPGGPVVAIGAVDNLGKGAAGQAVQNANLMTGRPATAGLMAGPLWP